MRKKIVVVFMILLFLILNIPLAQPQTVIIKKLSSSEGNAFYVGGVGPNNYSKIQDAIDNASDGDFIYVYELKNPENVVINKRLTLIGINNPIILAHDYVVFDIVANGCSIEGFTVPQSNRSIRFSSNNNTLKNCTIKAFIWLSGSSDNYIFNNRISVEGIRAYGPSNRNNISSNSISNTLTSETNYGLRISDSVNNMIFQNVFDKDWRGMYIDGTINTTIMENHFYGCGLTIGGNTVVNYNSHTIINNYLGFNQKIYYFVNKNSVEIPDNAGQVFLINCTHCNVSNLNVPGYDNCINLFFSSENTIAHNNINSVIYGIYLYNSTKNNIVNNILNCYHGIYGDFSHDNIISYNIINHTTIYFYLGNSNVISHNDIRNNGRIYMLGSRNKVSFNTLNDSALEVDGDYSNITGNILTNSEFYVWGKHGLILKNQVSNCSNCITVEGGSHYISKNILINCTGTALTVSGLHTIICNNILMADKNGIELIRGGFNWVTNNNIYHGAYFFDSINNHWFHNYWGRPSLFPRIILGKVEVHWYFWYDPILNLKTPWIKFDLRPRSSPITIQ